jgi:hypothetical protein
MTQLREVGAFHPAGTTARHEPVFLLAPTRSYSTVTVALLAGHPGIYGFPEMLLFVADTVRELVQKTPRPRQPAGFVESQRSGILRAVADLREASQDTLAIVRAEQWLAERSSWSPQQLMNYLLELAHPQIGLEKSPETVLTDEALEACLESYPNARYIHLIRHPADTMRSYIEHVRPWVQRNERAVIVSAASAWYRAHARIMARLAQLPARQWTRIRAEDLLRDPATSLPRLLGWLDLPADGDLIAQMMRTENWRFAGTGPAGTLYGGDPKFLRSPALRPVPEPGAIGFDESWHLLDEMRDRMIALAGELGYDS